LTSELEAEVRAIVFAHLRGIVLIPVVRALCDRGVFEMFRDPEAWVEFDQIATKTRANRGYLKVALRLLVSAGWLKWRDGASWALTPEGLAALHTAAPLFRDAAAFIPMAILLEDLLFGGLQSSLLPSLQALIDKSVEGSSEVYRNLQGVLVGPAMVVFARRGILDKLQQCPVDLNTIDGNQPCLSFLFDLLVNIGWSGREGDRISLTATGKYAASIASAYGVTVSYLPMFSVVSTLLFGNPRIPRTDDSGVELLVNRAVNVWAAGGEHRKYYASVDEIIVEIFNRPIELQPSGVCDMGCGDGSFLEHIYNVVKDRTARGRVLSEYPLLIVGADYNKVSRRVTKQNLKKARVPHSHVIHGDLNRPALLAGELESLDVDIHDLLHVRAFLDHNRPYLQPSGYVRGTRVGHSSGAFAHLGDEISADELEENLVRHLRRWAPYAGRFGLVALELHTIQPELAAANRSKTPAVAYDGANGFSDQYLVEIQVFLDCAREAGLHADPRFQARFPNSDLATVSVNLFNAPQA
jgi:hypothetical protein